MSKKERLVAAIKNGTVIDHIPADKTYQVATLLGLEKLETPVTIGNNFASKKVKNKGIIKVSDKFFTKEEISRLSVVAPNVVLNIIQDYEVVEKKMVETPNELKGIVKKAERNGYITIEEAEGERTYAVKLTDEGKKIAEKRVAANEETA